MKTILFILGILFLVGCAPVTQKPTVEEGFVPDRTIEIDAFSFGYNPNSISLKEGEKIRLIITNIGNIRHTFTSPELDIDVSIRGKSTETVDFVSPMTGDVVFFCTVIGHRPLGMEGNFNIE